MWNSNFVFKMRKFSDIWLQKCRYPEIRVRGHSRSLKMVPFDRLGMVSYECSVETLSIRRIIFWNDTSFCNNTDVLSLLTRHFWSQLASKMPWPWNRVRGPSRSLEMSIRFDFLLTFYSNWLYLVWLLRYSMSKKRDLEIRSEVTQGH